MWESGDRQRPGRTSNMSSSSESGLRADTERLHNEDLTWFLQGEARMRNSKRMSSNTGPANERTPKRRRDAGPDGDKVHKPKARAATKGDKSKKSKRTLTTEIGAILVLLMGTTLFLSLISFDPGDLQGPAETMNLIGPVGAHLADILLDLFGLGSFALAGVVVLLGTFLLLGRRIEMKPSEIVGQILLVVSGAALFHMIYDGQTILDHMPGGAVGAVVSEVCKTLFNEVGTYLLCLAVALLGFVLITDTQFSSILQTSDRLVRAIARLVARPFIALGAAVKQRLARRGQDDDDFEPAAEPKKLQAKAPKQRVQEPSEVSDVSLSDASAVERLSKAMTVERPAPLKRSVQPVAPAPLAEARPSRPVLSDAPTRQAEGLEPLQKVLSKRTEGPAESPQPPTKIASILAKLSTMKRHADEADEGMKPSKAVEPAYEFESIVPPEVIADGRVLAGWKPTTLSKKTVVPNSAPSQTRSERPVASRSPQGAALDKPRYQASEPDKSSHPGVDVVSDKLRHEAKTPAARPRELGHLVVPCTKPTEARPNPAPRDEAPKSQEAKLGSALPEHSEEARAPKTDITAVQSIPAELAQLVEATGPALEGFGPSIVVSEARRKPLSDCDFEGTIERKVAPDVISTLELPPLSLLDFDPNGRVGFDAEHLKMMADKLEQKLADYKVKCEVVQICPGPVVTRFELLPAPGTKVATIAGLADDLKMALEAIAIRVIAPIPGKGVVGIEVPNPTRETVYMKEILGSKEFREAKSVLSLALGKDIEGNPVVQDLAKMPHLLVAGATGAGKSVSINTMVCSLLYNARPEDVRMILVDPKRLELSIYEGIPHLLLPPITDPKKAAVALRWAVEEMERRYTLMAEMGVRGMKAYNQKIQALLKQAEAGSEEARETLGLDESDTPIHEHLPYIVLVIDELADLMMVAAKEVEMSIARLAQMARACGIHLILATQRPSVDVLTGLIKANFPTRISFRVFSRHDSKTILDTGGAEALLGLGDMLMLPPGSGQLTRVHGAFLSDQEVERIVGFLKSQAAPQYNDEILSFQGDESAAEPGSEDEYDEFYDQAVRIVTESGQASISMLQRKLRVGYNRAARMIELMEEQGIVGPSDGSKKREVLVSAQ